MSKKPFNYQSESSVHTSVCTYLQRQYPKVIFNTDLSGIKLTIGQAKKVKTLRSGRAWPDIFVAYPNGESHGLFIELKASDVVIYKKDGQLISNPHIQEQDDMLNHLRSLGYKAEFGIGFDDARRIIDSYLNEKH